jgi:hypothetical protein
MLVAVKDAGTKVCPHLPVDHQSESDSGGTVVRVRHFSRCLGSECCAWRWHDPAEQIEIRAAGETDADFAKRRDRIRGERRGFCGIAGTPVDHQ